MFLATEICSGSQGSGNSLRCGHQERDIRENETITVEPVGVLGVEVHELVEQNVSHGGHAHGGTRVTRVGLGGGINLDESVSKLLFS